MTKSIYQDAEFSASAIFFHVQVKKISKLLKIKLSDYTRLMIIPEKKIILKKYHLNPKKP